MSAGHAISVKVRYAMYQRDNWRCRVCNDSRTLTPHHIVYRSQGGTHDLDNLITLCTKCHDDVHGGRLKIDKLGIGTIGIKRLEGWKP